MPTLLQIRLEIEKVSDITAYIDNARCRSSQTLNWLHLRLWRDSFDELIVSNETCRKISPARCNNKTGEESIVLRGTIDPKISA